MSEQPRTKQEALAEALLWGKTRSHWNECATASMKPEGGFGPEAWSETARADAAEVQRLAALADLLPDETQIIDVVFDGPPSHESGRFVEVEDAHGRSVGVGEWREREDGMWCLRFTLAATQERTS